MLCLTYGLVDPLFQHQGIGTTMCFARFGLIPLERAPVGVMINALETSMSFYQRLGFQSIGRMSDVTHRFHVACLQGMTAELIDYSRALLDEAGAKIDWLAMQIPEQPECTGEDAFCFFD